MKIEWPKNRAINIVFHGHSIPAGYFKTLQVNTMGAYPNLLLKKLKAIYQFGMADSYKAFEFLYADKEQLSKYMSQVNLPNELGHELIVDEIIKWFK